MGKNKINITDEELAGLKEQGLSYREIAKRFQDEGKQISLSTVYNRLTDYYESQGKEKPKAQKKASKNRIDITDEELAELKKQGMSCKGISEHYKNKDIKISDKTIYKRLSRYYTSQGKELPKPIWNKKINIDIDEAVKLRNQGLTYEAIAKHFQNAGKQISYQLVYNRLTEYYKAQGIEDPNTKNISNEELAKLKEQGLSYKAIVEYYKNKGIKISYDTVQKKIKEYYKLQGTKPPRAKREPIKKINIDIDEAVKLRNQGLTYEEIVEHFQNEGKQINCQLVYRRLKEYYEAQGIENPNTKNRIDISNEELAELKEQGLSYEAIVEYYQNKGIKICYNTVLKKITKYYKLQGAKPPRAKKQINIEEAKELAKLKEEGLSYKEIEEHYKSEGKEINKDKISKILKEYYKLQGTKPPRAKREPIKKINIEVEELAKLREKGLAYEEIVEHCQNEGIQISVTTVYRDLKKYYEEQKQIGIEEELKNKERKEKELEKKKQEINKTKTKSEILDTQLTYMLMKGLKIRDYCSTQENSEELEVQIRKRLGRLRKITECAKKEGDKWVTDTDFLEVVKFLERENVSSTEAKYKRYISEYIKGGICDKGKINLIKSRVFYDNEDLMTFILNGYNIYYGVEYDSKIRNKQVEKFKNKVDKYFTRLHTLEKRVRENKEMKKAQDKNKGVNPHNQGEGR